ncbi:MAG: ABC transporter ATP-binding protein [Candidatus Hydrogenedentes bacterium]|nr:ABC transporter ATP-binding protein [Candidatus Hydrogenedentota bacterium]
MPIIDARAITKTYPHSGRGVLLGRGGIASWFGPKASPRQALAPMTLSIEAGESVGIIGRNGSGKSTLLKLIAGVSSPSSGTLAVHGRVASLLELGAGFHPMLTGRENVYLNAGLLGMRHAQTDACFDAIVDFAEMGEFIDQTVDTYSSGMYVRLAFSVAIHTNPDIFLVDEVLSVGDEGFQRKCRARILELKNAGKTILFVSHDLGIVNTLCDRVILLDQGQVISRGGAQTTIDFYLRQIGHASAVHRLASGNTEAIFNHGRLSIFHAQREVTAPAGIKAQFFSLGQYHESTVAEWRLIKATETELEAAGVLPRLPVTIFLHVRIEADAVSVETSWENHRPIELSYAALQCFFPTSFTRWQFGADAGGFPAITFNDRQWSNVVPATHEPGDCYLLEDAEGTTALRITCEGNAVPLQLDNTDYLAQARLAHVTEAFPSSLCPLPPGRRSLASLAIDCGCHGEAAEMARQDALSARSIHLARGFARMDAGAIAIVGEEGPRSAGLHLHVQIKVDGLWMLSQGLQWDTPHLDNARVVATGRSMRLPFSLEWSMAHAEIELTLNAALIVERPLLLDEYNISLNLTGAFTDWKTSEESGHFEVDAPVNGWRHLNTRFAPGDWIQASSATLPAITLRGYSTLGTIHPTAILTGGGHSGPLLQLLCSPGQAGRFTLQPGRHELFSGRVTVELDTEK